MTKNSQIASFLTYYFELPTAPQYAVMLKGRWGTGKTFFIKQNIAALGTTRKSLYVSLNGVSSKKEIEDEFFRQLHPILTSKGMRLTGRILKGALKTTLKIDLDHDGKDDGTATVGVPDINISEYLDNPAGLVLVFDDLERCDIKIPEILGYINYFVEHHGYKVLVVANEDEIVEREQANPQQHANYLRIREKLIGKTFEIEPDLDSALSEFLLEITQTDARTCVESNRQFVRDLYVASKYQNLRHLRQALLDFARLVDVVDPARRNQDMLKSILGTFLIYSFEIRAGNLHAKEIEGLMSGWMQAAIKGDASKLATLRTKYVMFDALDNVLPESVWAEILDSGLIPVSSVNKSILESRYYAKREDRLDWLRLWDAFELSDQELDSVIKEAEAKLKNFEYEIVGHLKHIVGALLQLSAIGIYPVSTSEIVSSAKKNIDVMRKRGNLLRNEPLGEVLSSFGWAGRGFHGKELPEFSQISQYIKEAAELARKESLPEVAKELIEVLKTDPQKFARYLTLSNHEDNKYYQTPVLAHANVELFVDTLMGLSSPSLSTIVYTMESRYDHFRAELIEEKPWLEKLAEQLKEKSGERSGKMSGHWLNSLREKVLEAAVKLGDHATEQS
jgi:hypothetical protein